MRGAIRHPRTLAWLAALAIAGVALAVHQHRPSPGASLAPNVPIAAPGLEGRLLYTREGGLWTLRVADGVATQVVAPPELGQVTAARWSPDGTQIAYSVYEVRDRRIPVSEISVARADGTEPRLVLGATGAGVFYQQPVWSPDARSLYVVQVGQGQRRIARVELTSGDLQTVTEDVGALDASADGRWLTVVRSSPTGLALVAIDLASGQRRELVPEGQFDTIGSPRFDPASRSILFAGAGGRGLSWATPGSQGRERAAALLEALFRPPAAHAHGLPQDLFTVPIDGGPPRRLAALQVDDPATAWSPDGAHIAVLSSEYLATLPASGGSPTPVLAPGGLGTVDWTR